MAVFALWLLLWAAGSVFGPVQYHPTTPVDSNTYHDAGHDSGTR
jgi:hypothetical protein